MAVHMVNDYVVYRNNGVCRITDICKRDFGDGERPYYLITSVYDDNSVYFVPTDSDSKLKPVLGVDEINTIIDKSNVIETEWPEDNRIRSVKFNTILSNGDHIQILSLIKLLSLQKNQSQEERNRFYVNDQKILAGAERFIEDEFAFVLGIKQDKVIDYIINRVSVNQRTDKQ